MNPTIEETFKALHAYMTLQVPVGYQVTAEHSDTEYHRGRWIVDIFNADGDYIGRHIIGVTITNGHWSFDVEATYVPAKRLQNGDVTPNGKVSAISEPYPVGPNNTLVISIYYGRNVDLTAHPNELVKITSTSLFS